MAASLGVNDMDIAEISRMLTLKHTLLPMFQVSVAFLVLAWIAVSLRVYVRASVLRSFHWDDWLILLTLCVFTACCSCLIAIENIERSGAARTALANGLEAQVGLIDKIFGVSKLWMHFDIHESKLTSRTAHHGLHVSLYPYDSCPEARSCYFLPSNYTGKLLVAAKNHLHLYWNLHNLWHSFHFHRRLPVRKPRQFLHPGSQAGLHVG